MRKIFFLLSICLCLSFTADPILVPWNRLADVQFKKKWNDDVGMYFLYPTFGPTVKALQGKVVQMKGYMIPIDEDANILVISQQPMAACFFCGGAGPESIAQVKLKKPHAFKTDQIAIIRGTLKLNADNIEELNYILTNAEIVTIMK
ncbi:DUF3299 domain-containing protein [Arundinibacter roseus]|uniref:DUF3299 domain-containing protein n=1 Tax=Arundinibacter roseus TaxID=2070510 RepID=A0A4R4KB78_9BACT|nr:DUF3299 domain-containing protein [Arundinibacter roseus]TDB63711.1 DUF3299 domain-containing protein [Arundinibacter roseus]